jgi:uncharacterized lipoprotein YmbA
MILRYLVIALSLMALVSALACSGSKEPTYFALASRPAQSQAGAPPLIELRRPGIAGYLDRADIVTKVKDYQLKIDTNERWAEPLGDMVGRVLAQDLSTRLGESQVFVESGAISALPDAIVAIDVQTFDVGSDGQVTLIAQVVIETPGSKAATRAKRFTLHANPTADNTSALIASMSTLVADLSDGIAAMLREH